MGHCGQAAAERLREAVAVEDGMAYFEPPRWYQPSRQCLGFLLHNATGDAAAAEQARHPVAAHPVMSHRRGFPLRLATHCEALFTVGETPVSISGYASRTQ